MDFEDFIKIEHESPIDSVSKQINFFMTHFYNGDSQPEIKDELGDYHASHQQEVFASHVDILGRLEENLNLRTAGIEEIVQFAKDDPMICQEIDWSELKKKIFKRKLILKRNHAKCRVKANQQKKDFFVISNSEVTVDHRDDLQAELKKKRNRMSAQISRDRRKMKVQQLELSNLQLRRQTEKTRLENQKLRKQLEEFNKFEQGGEENTSNNKFLSLLMMFGILFMMSFFKGQPSQNTEIPYNTVKSARRKGVSHNYQAEEIIAQSKKKLMEIEEEGESTLGSKKNVYKVMEELGKMQSECWEWKIPRGLKRQIDEIKDNI